jgi:hypothetical protein
MMDGVNEKKHERRHGISRACSPMCAFGLFDPKEEDAFLMTTLSDHDVIRTKQKNGL